MGNPIYYTGLVVAIGEYILSSIWATGHVVFRFFFFQNVDESVASDKVEDIACIRAIIISFVRPAIDLYSLNICCVYFLDAFHLGWRQEIQCIFKRQPQVLSLWRKAAHLPPAFLRFCMLARGLLGGYILGCNVYAYRIILGCKSGLYDTLIQTIKICTFSLRVWREVR